MRLLWGRMVLGPRDAHRPNRRILLRRTGPPQPLHPRSAAASREAGRVAGLSFASEFRQLASLKPCRNGADGPRRAPMLKPGAKPAIMALRRQFQENLPYRSWLGGRVAIT